LVGTVLIWVTIREIQKIIPEDFDAGIVPTVAPLPVRDLNRRACESYKRTDGVTIACVFVRNIDSNINSTLDDGHNLLKGLGG
jgi:hypothetical protein